MKNCSTTTRNTVIFQFFVKKRVINRFFIRLKCQNRKIRSKYTQICHKRTKITVGLLKSEKKIHIFWCKVFCCLIYINTVKSCVSEEYESTTVSRVEWCQIYSKNHFPSYKFTKKSKSCFLQKNAFHIFFDILVIKNHFNRIFDIFHNFGPSNIQIRR